jgi:SAM-dependent methyltransferase
MEMRDTMLEQLHRRYLEQAVWTAASRSRLLDLANLEPGSSILEVGSGTGVICADTAREHDYQLFGLDINQKAVSFATRFDPHSNYLVGDGFDLPFPSSSFDAVFCHFLLLWVEVPSRILHEMLRILHPGGRLITFAEPDYGGRVDHPPELVELGLLQIEALQRAGAHPFIGRRLRGLLHDAGARHIFSGVIGAEWHPSDVEHASSSEREILLQDLGGDLPDEQLRGLFAVGQNAALAGDWTLFVPTFFALGYAPEKIT